MNDAFIAAIIANPQDDLTRLIYADYLDAHGDAERSEFIRVQCELANVPECRFIPNCEKMNNPKVTEMFAPKYCDDCRNRIMLQSRDRELLRDNGFAWREIGKVSEPGGLFLAQSVFTRGFISSITCSSEDWFRHAEAITQATPLERVTLTTTPELLQDAFASEDGVRYRMLFLGPESERATTIAAWLNRRWPNIQFTLSDAPYIRLALDQVGHPLPTNPLVNLDKLQAIYSRADIVHE